MAKRKTQTKGKDAADDGAASGAPRPRSFWSGTISFGLVSIPVELYAANRPGRPGLRMLSAGGAPVQRRYVSKDGKEVQPEHLVRGYETAPGEHVVITDKELAALAPEKSRDIDLSRFVPVEEVDPVLFVRAYFLAPTGTSTKAYRLLADVMERTGRAGIATFVMRDKEYLVAILAEGGILRAETLRFAGEVRSAEQVGLPERGKVAAATVKKLERAITARAKKTLDLDELTDPWTDRLVALAEKKRRQGGEDVVEIPEEAAEERAEVIDLMEVLKRSLAGESGRRGGGRGATTRRAPARAKPTAARGRSAGSKPSRARAARKAGTRAPTARRRR